MPNHQDNEKRKMIKETARKLFFRFGFTKTSMEDIAVECGLAKPTLYYYYSNKEALFNEIVIEEARNFMNRVQKKLPKDAPSDEKIAIYFRMVYDGLKKYGREMERMPAAICEYSPHGRPIINKIYELMREHLRPLLRQARQEQKIAYEDEEVTLNTLVFMTDFLNLDWMQAYPEEMRDRVVDTMIQIILNGLKRRSE